MAVGGLGNQFILEPEHLFFLSKLELELSLPLLWTLFDLVCTFLDTQLAQTEPSWSPPHR